MSIRLRLTLLYSSILTLTLIIFGVALYSIQAQGTLDGLKRDLYQSSDKVFAPFNRTLSASAPQGGEPHDPLPAKELDEFSDGAQAFQNLRKREIMRILDGEGTLITNPDGVVEELIPLSAEGLAALQANQDWWETGIISDEEMLIYSRPVVQGGETVYIVQVARSLTERNRTLQELATTLVGAGALVILIAFAAGWTIAGFTLRPIQRMTQTAQRIGDERDFTRRVDYSGPEDEIGRLANTFNQMLSRLQDAYEKVEHSLEMQRNFVADVSHELRTPLTTLRGNLGLLRHKPDIDEQDDILNDMVDESDRLIRLVKDLLLLARADAGRSLAKESVDVFPVLEESVRQARQLDKKRTINLSVSDDIAILGDRDAFKQVILILLDNALKHSSGKINVTARSVDARVQIRVQDYGEGIAPETLEHIFDRFYRGEEAEIGSGFGLGLAIAKALVEGMDGEISIESEKGQGSSVFLNFSDKVKEEEFQK